MQYTQQKPESIQSLFNTIAPRYDRANACLSFGLHHIWNRALARCILQEKPRAIVDLCAGTGEIAFRLLAANVPIHLIDFSENMLEVAKKRASLLPLHLQEKLHFIQGDVTQLPFEKNQFSHASLAYGIRNVENPERCLEELFRVLQPGGKAFILELTRPNNPLLSPLHRLYLHGFLPLVGKLITNNKEAYSYLQKSIHNFISPAELQRMGYKAGFSNITIQPLTFGTATLITLEKG